MKNGKEIGYRLAEARRFLELKQDEFGTKLGLLQSGLSKIERGQRIPTLELIWEIENVFGIRSDFLISGSLPILQKMVDPDNSSEPHPTYTKITRGLIDASGLEAELDSIRTELDKLRQENKEIRKLVEG